MHTLRNIDCISYIAGLPFKTVRNNYSRFKLSARAHLLSGAAQHRVGLAGARLSVRHDTGIVAIQDSAVSLNIFAGKKLSKKRHAIANSQ